MGRSASGLVSFLRRVQGSSGWAISWSFGSPFFGLRWLASSVEFFMRELIQLRGCVCVKGRFVTDFSSVHVVLPPLAWESDVALAEGPALFTQVAL
jgi:hypothetical protein